MKPTFFLGCLLWAWGVTLSAQPPQPTAAKVWQQAQQAFSDLRTLQADLYYELRAPMLRLHQRRGTLAYEQGKYLIQLPELQIVCDGTTQWTIDMETGDVQVIDYELSADASPVGRLRQLFAGSPQLTGLSVQAVGGTPCYRLSLRPRAQNVAAVYLWVAQDNFLPRQVTFIDQRQTEATYEFVSLQQPADLPDEMFTFGGYVVAPR